uniref:WASH complex subunit CCDC53 n=1 Tax=Ascaris lumbricoides TaxID=6252 RepID=A0A0M3HU47_ASCLU
MCVLSDIDRLSNSSFLVGFYPTGHLMVMTEPDLSFIDADINLRQVRPLDSRRVIACTNFFIMKAIRFLNDFANHIQGRIIAMEERLERVETKLILLEAEVDSVADIRRLPKKTVVSDNIATNATQPAEGVSTEATSEKNAAGNIPNSVEVPTQKCIEGDTNTHQSSNTEQQTSSSGIKVSEDVRYAKYFRMLKVGVVALAVKQKMASEGIDPSILDNPEAIVEGCVAVDEVERQLAKSSTSSDDGESDSIASFSDTE